MDELPEHDLATEEPMDGVTATNGVVSAEALCALHTGVKRRRPQTKTQAEHVVRKRRRRNEQKELVATLDGLLPESSRRCGFKGAGFRSPGVAGRSLFNVLSDTLEHVRSLSCAEWLSFSGPSPAAPLPVAAKLKTLKALGLRYRDVMLSCRSTVALEVVLEPETGELVLAALSAGAREWFKDAPWRVGEGTRVRDLVPADEGGANTVAELRAGVMSSRGRTTTTSASIYSMEANIRRDCKPHKELKRLRLARFYNSEAQAAPEAPEAAATGGAGAAGVARIDCVEYVVASAEVCFVCVFWGGARGACLLGYVHACIRTVSYMHACIIHAYIHTCIDVYRLTSIHTYPHTHTHTNMPAHTRTHARTRTHTHTHTHTGMVPGVGQARRRQRLSGYPPM